MESQDLKISKITTWKIMEAAHAIMTLHESVSAPHFLHIFMIDLAQKIYESAPNCEEAERLMTNAIQIAKDLYTKK